MWLKRVPPTPHHASPSSPHSWLRLLPAFHLLLPPFQFRILSSPGGKEKKHVYYTCAPHELTPDSDWGCDMKH